MSTVEPRPDLTVLRDSQVRQRARDGVPMYLALVDETRTFDHPPGAVAAADGAAVAWRVDEARSRLAPHLRDDDLGVTISLLQTVAHADFDELELGAPDVHEVSA